MKKRLLLAVVAALAIALYFWTQSRYPALQQKAESATTMRPNGLSFGVILPVKPEYPVYQKIIYTTANWANTNRQGMTFGVFFGAAFLTLLKLLPAMKRRGRIVNTLKGIFIGMPLGVCVNCVTPIMEGMRKSGSKLETLLATMFSSPALNVIVLTMTFSIFPFYFAMTRLIVILGLIIVGIPLLTKYWFKKEAAEIKAQPENPPAQTGPDENWPQAFKGYVIQFAKDLWYVTYVTVPFMILAGFLGSVLIVLLPLERFVNYDVNFLTMGAAALVGTFLPVPMTFDVIAVYALRAAGLPGGLSMALLITLGIYSVYPMLVIWQKISPKVAVVIFGLVALLGFGGGYFVYAYENHQVDEVVSLYQNLTVHKPDAAAERSKRPARDATPDLIFAHCLKYDQAADRELCKKMAAEEAVAKGADISLCDQLKGGMPKECRFDAVTGQVKESGDLKLCLTLPDSLTITQCVSATTVVSVYKGNKAACAELGQKDYVDACQQEFTKYQTHQLALAEVSANVVKNLSNTSFGKKDAARYMAAAEPKVTSRPYYSDQSVKITASDFEPVVPAGDKPFTKYEGISWGIDNPDNLDNTEFNDPFVYGRGIASGDFNNDGWPDLLLATRHGIQLYKNTGAHKFLRVPLNIPEISDLDVFAVAFIDINNDGWQDIFLTSYGGKNYFLLNDKEAFSHPQVVEVPEKDNKLTEAAGFADVNRDGWLDLVDGNWINSAFSNLPWKYARNRLFLNDHLNFSPKELDEIPGDSLSVLLSDINGDGIPDLLVGNDFAQPDNIYLGQPDGTFKRIKAQDNIIPATSYHTMSYDTGDVDNDLKPEIFIDDLGADETNGSTKLNLKYCDNIQDASYRDNCRKRLSADPYVKNNQADKCLTLPDFQQRKDCLVGIMINIANNTRVKELCEKITDDYASKRQFCADRANRGLLPPYKDPADALKQVKRNVLLAAQPDGKFEDWAKKMGVDYSGWSWNAKFADLDNDGWQDIYVGQGYQFYRERPQSNVFYHNNQGKDFTQAQKEFGLEDFINTPSYTYVDLNNDGNLDIVAYGVAAPVQIFMNNQTKNKSIEFEFRDKKGNTFGIGNRIYIYYGAPDRSQPGGYTGHQMREIKESGGFLSFDAPVAHFGLGSTDEIQKVEIAWSTGEKTTINTKFLAGKKYIISREK